MTTAVATTASTATANANPIARGPMPTSFTASRPNKCCSSGSASCESSSAKATPTAESAAASAAPRRTIRHRGAPRDVRIANSACRCLARAVVSMMKFSIAISRRPPPAAKSVCARARERSATAAGRPFAGSLTPGSSGSTLRLSAARVPCRLSTDCDGPRRTTGANNLIFRGSVGGNW